MDKTQDILKRLLQRRVPAFAEMPASVLDDTASEAAMLTEQVQPYRQNLQVSDAPFDFETQLQRARVV